jgi:hypothetical protein
MLSAIKSIVIIPVLILSEKVLDLFSFITTDAKGAYRFNYNFLAISSAVVTFIIIMAVLAGIGFLLDWAISQIGDVPILVRSFKFYLPIIYLVAGIITLFALGQGDFYHFG